MKSKSKTKKIVLIVIVSLLAIAFIFFVAIKMYVNSEIKKVTNGPLYKIGTSMENLLNNGKSFHFNITNTQNSSNGIDIEIYEGDILLDKNNKSISMAAKYSKISSTEIINQNYIITKNQLVILDNQNKYISSYDITNYQNALFSILSEFEGSGEIKSIKQAQNLIDVDWKKIFNDLTGNENGSGGITDYFIAYDKFGECINTLFMNYNNSAYLDSKLIDFKQTYTDDIPQYTFIVPLSSTFKDIIDTISPSIEALIKIINIDNVYQSVNKVDFINISVSTKNKFLNALTFDYKLDDKNIITSLSLSNIGNTKVSENTLTSAYQAYLDNK